MTTQTKIALVTGGSRGLGKDMALSLGAKGLGVILTYNSKKEEAEAVVHQIESLGQKAIALQLDIGQISSLDSFIAQVKNALNNKWQVEKFDFLINNAGIGASIPFAEATEEAFDLMTNIHFKGVYFLTQKFLPLLNDRGGIVNVSSGTTRVTTPGYSIYAPLKAAIECFTKYLAKDLGSRGIRANVLAPGPIETDFNGAAIRNNAQMKQYLSTQTALGRVGTAEDIGSIVAFLCSEESYWINAQRIEASGGMFL